MNISNYALAFIEGVAMITSPCTYPIIPLLLSTATTGGKSRPFAIMAGFFVSFTIFVFTARYLISYFDIMPSTLTKVSIAFLLFFGAVLIFDGMTQRFAAMTSGIANFGARLLKRVEKTDRNDPLVGFLTGSTIALVWTPCAGPILALVLTQVIRETDNLTAVGIVLAFSIGVTVPFLAISLLGRRAMATLNWLPKNNRVVKKILGVIIILSAALIASNSYAADIRPIGKTFAFEDDLYDNAVNFKAPKIVGIQQWLNTDKPLQLRNLRGKVVIVKFWTFSCYNCRNTLPAVNEWHRKYSKKGLVIIGIHAPEFSSDKSISAIQKAIERHRIRFPVPVDNKLQTWDNYHNNCWPAFYFINKYGRVVRALCGEHNYSRTEKYIEKLLAQ